MIILTIRGQLPEGQTAAECWRSSAKKVQDVVTDSRAATPEQIERLTAEFRVVADIVEKLERFASEHRQQGEANWTEEFESVAEAVEDLASYLEETILNQVKPERQEERHAH